MKPRVIRFFRNAMFNMVSLALKDLKVRVVPSRSTNALYSWIDEREQDVYSKMPGYDPLMKDSSDVFGLREPEVMPDGLMGDKYAFMCLPVSHFLDGEINYDNCGIGRLFQLDPSLPKDKQVQGIVIYSSRAKSIAAWLQSCELCFIKVRKEKILGSKGWVKINFLLRDHVTLTLTHAHIHTFLHLLLQANFSKRQMQLEVGIDTQYLFATLNDVRRVEGRCALCMDD